jgi:hypothetical protein
MYRGSGDAHEMKDKDGAKDRLLRHRRRLFDKHDRLGRSRQDSVRGNSGLRGQIDTRADVYRDVEAELACP